MNTLIRLTVLLLPCWMLAQPTSTFTGKPIFDIEARQNNQVMGVIKVELFPTIAPRHARSFDSLVSVKFYDTTAFHRVIPGFVIQGGDPNSRHGPPNTWGFGDPSQPTVQAEFSLARHLRGTLAGARKANDTNSYTSQFYICVAPQPQLDKQYTIFGRVLAGMDVVDAIVNAPQNTSNNQPLQKIEMFVSRNGSNDSIPLPPPLLTPNPDTNFVNPPTVVQLKWNKVNDAVFYHLQIALDSAFTTLIEDRPLNALTFNYAFPPWNTKIYWRVLANNGGRLSSWSSRMFSTFENPVALPNHGLRPPKITIGQQKGKVTFSGLNEGTTVSLFDMQGKLVTEDRSSGQEVQLPTSNLPQGVYHYRCSLHGNTYTTGSLLIQ